MDIEQAINEHAIRSFRGMADRDYISARLSFKFQLMPQFFWQGLQAVEKYIKCILLLHRVSSKDLGHDLYKGVKELFKIKRIDAKFSEQAIFFLLYLDKYGKDRYLEQGYNAYSEQLIFLDQLVAEMRIYCRLDYETIKEIEDVRCIRIDGGTLESILDDLNHPAREALLWENAFFGEKRNMVALPSFVIAERSELIYSPEMIEKLKEYIYLPKSIVQKYSNLSRGLS